MRLNIKNEYDSLKKVILGPVSEEYLDQQKEMIELLKKHQVEILITDFCEETKYQMFVRDPFVVIGNKIILCNMKEDIRKKELKTMKPILKKLKESNILKTNEDTLIEGGDIIPHNDKIFVGQNGNRTNLKGMEFLQKHFENKYEIIPLKMINPDSHIPWVHLDCLMNPISSDTVILYPEGFDQESLKIIKKIFPNQIIVNKQEQEELATNVISLGNKTVMVQSRHTRLIGILKEKGFQVEEMNHYETIKETGYNRCLTCPLERIQL